MYKFIILAIVSTIVLDPATQAATLNSEAQATAAWVLEQIKLDEIADLNKRCGTSALSAESIQKENCRTIHSIFLEKLLTDPRLQGNPIRHRVRIRGAYIAGPVDISDSDIEPEVWIDGSKIDGEVRLDGTHFHRLISIQQTIVNGDFSQLRRKVTS